MAATSILQYVNGRQAASAQGDIANAQLGQQRADRDLALRYAEATPEEIAQIQKGISLNEGDIKRKERLLASSDPALLEAGTQALQLLRGEEAKTLGPLKSKIAKQEQELRQKLQAQLGPGYENTTAGIQALNAFNEQANNAYSAAQQSSLGQLLGVAQDTSSRYGMQSNIANNGSLANLYANIGNRKVSAINGTPITGAGAQFIGDLQQARNNNQFLGNIKNDVGQAVGMAAGMPTGGVSGGGLMSAFSGGSPFGPSTGSPYMTNGNVA